MGHLLPFFSCRFFSGYARAINFSLTEFRAVLSLMLLICLSIGNKSYADDVSELESNFSNYARYGADAWSRNPLAKIAGDGVACVSCHTSLPYAMVEPLLPSSYAAYDEMLSGINSRILGWETNTPWYAEEKVERMAIVGGLPKDKLKPFLRAAPSRGSEAVINAFIRAMSDAYEGKPAEKETKLAFKYLWQTQLKSGDKAGLWDWIKTSRVPWEASDSDIWGGAMVCVAASLYPDLAPQENVKLLYSTLNQAIADADVSLHTKASILWCDSETGGRLLSQEISLNLVNQLLDIQREDGGWAFRNLGPWTGWEGGRADCCAQREIRSDMYATGFITLILERNKHLIPSNKVGSTQLANTWLTAQLNNPFPAEPRHNRHSTNDKMLPELRDNLYANAGAMWAYIANWTYKMQRAPWQQSELSDHAAEKNER